MEDQNIEKAVKPEVTKETLLGIIKELQEIIVGIVSDEECDMDEMGGENEMEGMPEMDDANPAPIGDPNKNDVNWPVAKTEGQVIVNEVEREILNQNTSVKKSLFDNLDPFYITKRKFSSKQRERMASEGHAMPDGSYPIANRTDLMNAIRSWGRGGSDPKVKEHIKRRARALGASDMIPENWK